MPVYSDGASCYADLPDCEWTAGAVVLQAACQPTVQLNQTPRVRCADRDALLAVAHAAAAGQEGHL